MRKKPTAPSPRKHRKASPAQQPGLIAQGKTPSPSARGTCALDDRSHRTLCASPAGDSLAGGAVFKRAAMYVGAQMNDFLKDGRARRVQALVGPLRLPLWSDPLEHPGSARGY
jgi:hypothetical protein